MKEQAVSSEAAGVVGDGGRSAGEGSGDLSVGHATDEHGVDRMDQSRAFLPIRDREGL